MQNFLKGRVVETWSDKGQFFVELWDGIKNSIFPISKSLSISSIKKGDIIQIETESFFNSKFNKIEKLGGPQQGQLNPLSDVFRWNRFPQPVPRLFRLKQRQEILIAIRQDLYENGFLEVETPLLVKGTCPDTHIDSIHADEGYLVTSTEYQIKRLIVGGAQKVFTLTKNFRANDRGRYHSTEFTMLEWARAFETLTEIEEDLIRFARKAFQRLYPSKDTLYFQGSPIQLMKNSWKRMTVREAFQTYLGLENLKDFSLEPLCKAAKSANIVIPSHFQQDKHLIISYLLDLLQPFLGRETPVFLREWPSYMTSSAQLNLEDPDVAERSELYIAGVEISDGFPFLRDAQIQRALFERELQRRREEGKKVVDLDEKYLEALSQGIPPGAGMALGVDRLALVLSDSTCLSDVQAFGWDEL